MYEYMYVCLHGTERDVWLKLKRSSTWGKNTLFSIPERRSMKNYLHVSLFVCNLCSYINILPHRKKKTFQNKKRKCEFQSLPKS